MERVRQRLARHPDVQSVEVSERTGSVLVLGTQTERLRAALEEFLELVEEAPSPEAVRDRGVETAVTLVKDLDDRLAWATGGRLQLRWLIPATFVGFGVRQLIAQGLTIGSVPWYVLVYYGVDSFLKLYPEHAPQARLRSADTDQP